MKSLILFMLYLPINNFCSLLSELQIPVEHLEYFLYNNRNLKLICENQGCLTKKKIESRKCWGYEKGCQMNDSFTKIICDGDSKGWTSTMSEQIDMFYRQADFGYIKQFRDALEPVCEADNKGDSFLECSHNLEFCKGNSIAINFKGLFNRTQPVRYHMDVLKDGDITGKCRLDESKLAKSLDYISPLQSWAPELRYFQGKDDIICDMWVNKSTIIIKLDSSVNMYHHFCDFFNLFASQHVNSSNPFDFQTDTQILIWETYPYRSNFEISWKAYSKNPVWNLKDVTGKRVCFKNVMFPLLARGIYGLYYNTPIVPGCAASGLFRAFSHHFLHRLGVAQQKRDDKIHITFLSRTTKYRRINNEDQLIQALAKHVKYVVRKVEFTHYDPFIKQLEQDRWTDLLVGLHGSGLTHSLFLPNWAVLFELYSCGDPDCYRDLTRLRGLHYITWVNKEKMIKHDDVRHPEFDDHEKFRNYSFDKEEFLRLIEKGEQFIRSHHDWLKFQESRHTDEL